MANVTTISKYLGTHPLTHQIMAIDTGFTMDDVTRQPFLLVTTGASTITVVLPTVADNIGAIIYVKKVDAGAGKVVLDGEGAETINGYATWTMHGLNTWVRLIGTATGWIVIDGKAKYFLPEPERTLISNLGTTGVFADLDLSANVPINAKTVFGILTAMPVATAGSAYIYARKNGSSEVAGNTTMQYEGYNSGASTVNVQATSYVEIAVTAGIFEYACVSMNSPKFRLQGWEYDI